MFPPLNDTTKMIVTWPQDITTFQWWVVHGFNRLPAESYWTMLSDERCWVNLSHLVLTGNIWDVPGPGTWEVGWSELFSHPGDSLVALAPHFLSISSLRFCEIHSPGFVGRCWSASVRTVSPPNVYVKDIFLELSVFFDFSGSWVFVFFAHHSALPMTCRNFPFSRLSLFRCPVAAGLI